MEEEIKIRASAKRNGFSTALAGIVALILSAFLMSALPQDYNLAAIFLVSASLVTIIVGWLKIREPVYSMLLTRESVTYIHRYGTWQVEWNNILRIDVPTVHKGLQSAELALVGIKLKQYDPLLDSISRRLANNMLLEQRPLLLQNKPEVMEENVSNYGANLIENDTFTSSNKIQFKGIQAMFANRMTKLRERLGYDLFISESEIDRPVREFVDLLKACHQQALSTKKEQ